jgi:RNA recognition motif-containing protein
MNIYVGNLSFDMTEEDLRKAFGEHGQVASARIINDTYTGKSKGFGFVEMNDKAEAEAAIRAINGKDMKGRPVKVNEARPKTEGGGSNRGGGNRGGNSRW